MRRPAATSPSTCSCPTTPATCCGWGFTEDDFRDGGSDRLLDAVFAMGDETAIARRAAAYLDAGADHLAVQVVTGEPGLPREQWRRLAGALPLEA